MRPQTDLSNSPIFEPCFLRRFSSQPCEVVLTSPHGQSSGSASIVSTTPRARRASKLIAAERRAVRPGNHLFRDGALRHQIAPSGNVPPPMRLFASPRMFGIGAFKRRVWRTNHSPCAPVPSGLQSYLSSAACLVRNVAAGRRQVFGGVGLRGRCPAVPGLDGASNMKPATVIINAFSSAEIRSSGTTLSPQDLARSPFEARVAGR